MSTNTSGGTTTSFSNTPQAKDDVYANSSLTEDTAYLVTFIIDVMANDLGGAAKSLYSLDDGIENEGSATSADLLTKDPAGTPQYSALGANISITADGKVAYALTATAAAAIQSTGAGKYAIDTSSVPTLIEQIQLIGGDDDIRLRGGQSK